MAAELARWLEELIEKERAHLRGLTDEKATEPRAAGKWSAKEELGHLIDSATNNHLRFVGAALGAHFHGPGYAQDDWVGMHGYGDMHWSELVEFWFSYNKLLARLVNRIPESSLDAECRIADHEPVTLGFLIEDYILHAQHHIDQLLRRETVTRYPGAAL